MQAVELDSEEERDSKVDDNSDAEIDSEMELDSKADDVSDAKAELESEMVLDSETELDSDEEDSEVSGINAITVCSPFIVVTTVVE
ncbi:uncharacterized protein KQ657_003921 [Scheffersomyces spartinae]|uniref:Uncharacterized protein n=1 Tax=Scheffersomyces spartinae TaxID=45513 RepID=A0A9P7V4U8_9ASCO|nr:uncharacterized protein KQ657_003921 [Scheffersomyces spartinae]KAG7191264.1 hypothetical protein KQ657_003921 [Scheffersomyces spartinae]